MPPQQSWGISYICLVLIIKESLIDYKKLVIASEARQSRHTDLRLGDCLLSLIIDLFIDFIFPCSSVDSVAINILLLSFLQCASVAKIVITILTASALI